MIEQQTTVTTPDGEMTTFVFHPEHGGPFPVVVYLMDAPAIRPALRDMASRLASAGYYVLLPDLYYRVRPFGDLEEGEDFELHDRADLMESTNVGNIGGDVAAVLDLAAGDPAAADGRAGLVGFCMSGSMAFAAAKALPERIAAVASVHGAWMVRDTPDSPHLGLDGLSIEAHLAWCDNDATAPKEHVEVFTDALEQAGIPYTLDFEEDAVHGFAPAGERHHREASERHWARVHALLDRTLRSR